MGPTPLGVQAPSDESDFFHSKWRFSEFSTRIGLVYSSTPTFSAINLVSEMLRHDKI